MDECCVRARRQKINKKKKQDLLESGGETRKERDLSLSGSCNNEGYVQTKQECKVQENLGAQRIQFLTCRDGGKKKSA